jgi:hypothetical protein
MRVRYQGQYLSRVPHLYCLADQLNLLLAGRPVLDPGLSAAVFAGWSAATNPCSGTWGGVTCAGAPGVVTHVQLSGAGLNGSLPDVWSGLVGLQVRWAGVAAGTSARAVDLGSAVGGTGQALMHQEDDMDWICGASLIITSDTPYH